MTEHSHKESMQIYIKEKNIYMLITELPTSYQSYAPMDLVWQATKICFYTICGTTTVLWIILLKHKIESYKIMRRGTKEEVSRSMSAKRDEHLKIMVSISHNPFYNIFFF